ncbi:hypothetical protein PG997_008960 [Apiospora hydei]|uniref:Fungal-type protein kinase domain-containing protein n=1 Tax=Apiospora hydei TaxID=1337664 RepID=A0ABR1WDQ0_9PEZI
MASNSTKAKLLQAIFANKHVLEWAGVTECRVSPDNDADIKNLRVTREGRDQIDNFMKDSSAVLDLTAPTNSNISGLTLQMVKAKLADGTKMASFDCSYFAKRREAEKRETSKLERITHRLHKFVSKNTQYEILEVLYSFICQVVDLLPEEDTSRMAPDDVDDLSRSRREDGWGGFTKSHKIRVFLKELGRINGKVDTWQNALDALEALLHIAGDEWEMLVLDRRDLIDAGNRDSRHDTRVNDLTFVLGQTFPPAHRFLMTRECEEPYLSWFECRLDDESNLWQPAEHFALCPSQEGLSEEGVLLGDMTKP